MHKLVFSSPTSPNVIEKSDNRRSAISRFICSHSYNAYCEFPYELQGGKRDITERNSGTCNNEGCLRLLDTPFMKRQNENREGEITRKFRKADSRAKSSASTEIADKDVPLTDTDGSKGIRSNNGGRVSSRNTAPWPCGKTG